nr:hypothetical protein [Tanacetum cinerariifolium]
MCCKKCIIVLEAQVSQTLGDLCLSHSKILVDNTAKNSFQTAKSNIEENEWRNSLSEPDRETSTEQTNPVLCHCEGPNDHCWHCLPMITGKSSLESL